MILDVKIVSPIVEMSTKISPTSMFEKQKLATLNILLH